jgi:hypothetical protein
MPFAMQCMVRVFAAALKNGLNTPPPLPRFDDRQPAGFLAGLCRAAAVLYCCDCRHIFEVPACD